MSRAYDEYERLLHEHQRLLKENREADADALTDRMDAPWYLMTEEERERARDLAARLNDELMERDSR